MRWKRGSVAPVKKWGGGGENEREGVRIGRQREEGKNPVKG